MTTTPQHIFKKDHRKQFFSSLIKLAKKDKDVILLVDDLGFSFIEEYQKKFPQQFLNCGVTEQSMIGIAAGLALGGKKPYVYGGTLFILLRAYEQVRDDVCYNNLDVKLCGTGASPFLGFTHNFKGTENEEDLLKNLPNLKRYYPKTEQELDAIMKKTYRNKYPTFVRL